MNILVTGANGFIGSYLRSEFEKTGTECIYAVREDFDYTDINTIRNFFEGKNIDKVVHLAGTVDNNDSGGLFDINIAGLYNFLTVCAEQKVSYIEFASSNNVYAFSSSVPFTEDCHRQPFTLNKYGISKYVSEMLIEDFCSCRNIKFSNIRIADVYGKNQRHGNLMRAIYDGVKKQSLYLYGKGERVRDYIYVKDVARGLEFVLRNELQGIFNLGTGKGTSVRELLNITSDIYGGNLKIIQKNTEKEDTSCVILDNSKLRSHGFETQYSVREGLTEILKSEGDL